MNVLEKSPFMINCGSEMNYRNKCFPASTLIMVATAMLFITSRVSHALPNDRGNYDLAVAEAKQDRKVLGIYFDKPGSEACLALKWRLLGRDRFEALTKGDLVYLMIQDRGTDQKGVKLMTDADLQLEKQFNITSFPTFLLLTCDGKLIDRIDGFNPYEDKDGDKYFVRIEAAITREKQYDAANPNASPIEQRAIAPAFKHDAALAFKIYEGDVIFTFADQSKLISHRTVEMTNDPAVMKLDCVDYFEESKFVKYTSKLLMKGTARGNTFYSTEQQCIKTNMEEWVPENITIEIAADGTSAALTSNYRNSTGNVVGKGVLILKR